MKTFLYVPVIALLLSACASSPKTSAGEVASVKGGDKGAIIASFGGERRCNKLRLYFENSDTGASLTSADLGADWMASAKNTHKKINILTVPPGQYNFKGGSCDAGNVVVTYRGIDRWFEPFEVKAGEAVYAGSLVPEVLTFKVDGVLDFIPEFISRAPTDKYQVYSLEDRSDLITASLAEEAPELSDQFVLRMPETRLEAETMEKILADAYAYEGKKKGPDGRKAAARASLAIARYRITGKYEPTTYTD